MFWRMIFQLWRHDLPRKSLAFLTIFLASALIAGLLAVSVDIGDKMSRELKSYGANILIEPAGGALLPDDVAGQQYFLDEKVLPSVMDIFWRNNIYGFAPLLSGRLRADGVEVATGRTTAARCRTNSRCSRASSSPANRAGRRARCCRSRPPRRTAPCGARVSSAFSPAARRRMGNWYCRWPHCRICWGFRAKSAQFRSRR